VKYMTAMFAGARSFDQYIGRWEVQNVESMGRMFDGAGYNRDLSKWCVIKLVDQFSFGALRPPNWGTCPGVPTVIIHNLPADKSIVDPASFRLSWNHDPFAFNYRLQIADESGSIVVDTLTQQDFIHIESGLITGDQYFWRVSGLNSHTQDSLMRRPVWSKPWMFTPSAAYDNIAFRDSVYGVNDIADVPSPPKVEDEAQPEQEVVQPLGSGLSIPDTGYEGSSNQEEASAPFRIEGLNRDPVTTPLPMFVSQNSDVRVTVRITVDPLGNVTQALPVRRGDPTQDREVLRVVRGWRFNPLPANAPQESQQGLITFVLRRP